MVNLNAIYANEVAAQKRFPFTTFKIIINIKIKIRLSIWNPLEAKSDRDVIVFFEYNGFLYIYMR